MTQTRRSRYKTSGQVGAVDKPINHEIWQRSYAGLQGVFLRKRDFVNTFKLSRSGGFGVPTPTRNL